MIRSSISPIKAMSVSSLSSDSSASTIYSPGTTMFLSICLYFHVACGRVAPSGFGRSNLVLLTKRFICLIITIRPLTNSRMFLHYKRPSTVKVFLSTCTILFPIASCPSRLMYIPKVLSTFLLGCGADRFKAPSISATFSSLARPLS